MRIFAGVPGGGASNDSAVVDEDIFAYLAGYFFGNFGDRANIIYMR